VRKRERVREIEKVKRERRRGKEKGGGVCVMIVNLIFAHLSAPTAPCHCDKHAKFVFLSF